MLLDDAMSAVTVDGATPTDLYRYYDRAGCLLYVGVSKSAVVRAMQHEHSAGWWDRWAVMRRHVYPTRELALAAEREAIAVERPAYNIVGVTRRPYGSAA